jgi:hypothetical protein
MATVHSPPAFFFHPFCQQKWLTSSPCGASFKRAHSVQLIWPSTLTCEIPSHPQQYLQCHNQLSTLNLLKKKQSTHKQSTERKLVSDLLVKSQRVTIQYMISLLELILWVVPVNVFILNTENKHNHCYLRCTNSKLT